MENSTKLASAVNEISDRLENELDSGLDLLKSLIGFQSVNPALTDSGFEKAELPAQEFLEEWLYSRGWDVELWEPDSEMLKDNYKGEPGFVEDRKFDGRPNLVARLPYSHNQRTLLLHGHIDVVPADESGWEVNPFEGAIKDNRIYGRGTVDMKGGLAAMLFASSAIADSDINPLGAVEFATVSDEEAGGMGTLALAHRLKNNDIPYSGSILGEPTNLMVAPVSRGILWGKIKIEGRSGHIEVNQPHWEEGGAVDAFRKGLKVVRAIDDLNREWSKRPDKLHSLLPRPCMINIAEFNAGHSPTSFADSSEITFNVQYLPQEQDEKGLGTKVKAEIEEHVARAAKLDPWLEEHPPEIDWIIDADSYELPRDHEFFKKTKEGLESSDLEFELGGVETHTDAGRIGYLAGIPTINLGPGEMRFAHQVNEHLAVENFLKAAKIYAALILAHLGMD
ncbi:ArgE/DapE family deacylase [Candidatus Bipolaricaulota bacterium]|nr:ArgE/DapE family deacylase [Candidatus Bipolaricaulota bacterium]